MALFDYECQREIFSLNNKNGVLTKQHIATNPSH